MNLQLGAVSKGEIWRYQMLSAPRVFKKYFDLETRCDQEKEVFCLLQSELLSYVFRVAFEMQTLL